MWDVYVDIKQLFVLRYRFACTQSHWCCTLFLLALSLLMRCISWSLLFPDFFLARCLVTAESAWARMSSSTFLLGWWSRCNCCAPFSLVMGHSAAGSLRLSLSPPPSRASWRLKDLCLLKSTLWLSVLDIVKCRSAVGLFCHHVYLSSKASTQPFPAFPVST